MSGDAYVPADIESCSHSRALALEAKAPMLTKPHVPTSSSSTCSRLMNCWPVLDPDESRFFRVWDIVMFVQLVIIAFLAPFETAFLTPELGPLFCLDRAMDIFFTVDTVLEFFTAFPDPARPGHTVKVPRRIIQNYLGGWFWANVLSTLPFDTYCVVHKEQCTEGFLGNLHRLHALRLLRLMRLLRLARLTKLVHRYNLYFGFSYSFLALIKFFVLIVMSCHWMACLWGSLGMMPSKDHHTWLTALRDAKGGPDELYEGPLPVYTLALYWAIITLTSIGYGDITPQTMLEYQVSLVCTAVMSCIWAYVIGAVCGIVSTMEPHEMAFKQTMDDLNWLMRNRGMPQEMCLKVRRYFHETREMNRRRTETEITEQMSPMLQGEFALHMHQKWIEKVWYLRNMSHEIIVFMSRKIKMAAYSPNEEVLSDRTLFILRRGICALAGKILVSGHTWGEDMLLNNETLRSKDHARSISYSFVIQLHVEDMADIVVEFPEARARLKWAQVQIAIIRGVRKIASITRELEKTGQVDINAMSDDERLQLYEDILQGRLPNEPSAVGPFLADREDAMVTRPSKPKLTWHSLKVSYSSETVCANDSRPQREASFAKYDAKFEELAKSLIAVSSKVDKLLASNSKKAGYSRSCSQADLGPLVISATSLKGSSRLLGHPNNLGGLSSEKLG